MSVRALDTFYPKGDKRLTVLCNRGLNGIDGTVSTALGAAQRFEQTTLLTGDLTLLHDLNALALQRELRVQVALGGPARSIVIDAAEQQRRRHLRYAATALEDPYFERLASRPRRGVRGGCPGIRRTASPGGESWMLFDAAYGETLGVPGISLVECACPLEGLPERYAPYWS